MFVLSFCAGDVDVHFISVLLSLQFEFQMPPKKLKHGGARKHGGRNPGDGLFTNDKTLEEKRKSHRELKAKVRGQLKVPEPRVVADGGGGESENCERVQTGPGRPSLDPEAGPMRGAVLAEYKLEKQRVNRKKQKISQIRQAAVANRKDRKSGEQEKLLGESSGEQALPHV